MEEKEFALRQATNEVTGMGYLKEFSLDYQTTENNVVIKGTITVAVDEKAEMKIFLNPRRAASEILTSILETGRISPLRPISAAKHTSGDTGRSKLEERTATATARSQAGSDTLSPPAMLRKTSFAPRRKPALFSRTARSMLSLRVSNPVAER